MVERPTFKSLRCKKNNSFLFIYRKFKKILTLFAIFLDHMQLIFITSMTTKSKLKFSYSPLLLRVFPLLLRHINLGNTLHVAMKL